MKYQICSIIFLLIASLTFSQEIRSIHELQGISSEKEYVRYCKRILDSSNLYPYNFSKTNFKKGSTQTNIISVKNSTNFSSSKIGRANNRNTKYNEPTSINSNIHAVRSIIKDSIVYKEGLLFYDNFLYNDPELLNNIWFIIDSGYCRVTYNGNTSSDTYITISHPEANDFDNPQGMRTYLSNKLNGKNIYVIVTLRLDSIHNRSEPPFFDEKKLLIRLEYKLDGERIKHDIDNVNQLSNKWVRKFIRNSKYDIFNKWFETYTDEEKSIRDEINSVSKNLDPYIIEIPKDAEDTELTIGFLNVYGQVSVSEISIFDATKFNRSHFHTFEDNRFNSKHPIPEF